MNKRKKLVYIILLCICIVGLIIFSFKSLHISAPKKTEVIFNKIVSKEIITDKRQEDIVENTPATPQSKVIKEINGLVSLPDVDESLIIDLKYFTTDNFTGKKVYPTNVCVLQKATAEKLAKANEEFKKNGYRIKIWDAYRPVYVQQIFWDIVKDDRFVANPATGGSKHNTGTAVDITLVDSMGNELKMPSKFDDFSINAYRDNSKVDGLAKKNMDYLTSIMKKSGFITISTEWWHFEDSNFAKYKVIDVDLNEFLKKSEVTISLIGDCTLGTDDQFDYSRSLPGVFKKNGNNYSYFFKNVFEVFKNDDYTSANLETTLTNSSQKLPKLFNFKGDPTYAKILKLGSIEGVNISNNHMVDFMSKGEEDTKSALKAEEIDYFGNGNVCIKELKGHKFAFLGYSGVQEDDSFDEVSIKTLKQDIEKFKQEGCTVIINIHWGTESQYYPNETQKRIAHYAIDNGADLIVGHHPHVIEGIELYKGKYICYSLGNFCFGGNSNPPDYDTFIFQTKIKFVDDKIEASGVRVIPCSISSVSSINDYCPTPLTEDKKENLLTKLNKLSFNLTSKINDEFTFIENTK